MVYKALNTFIDDRKEGGREGGREGAFFLVS
jgi:hypothetical protein